MKLNPEKPHEPTCYKQKLKELGNWIKDNVQYLIFSWYLILIIAESSNHDEVALRPNWVTKLKPLSPFKAPVVLERTKSL